MQAILSLAVSNAAVATLLAAAAVVIARLCRRPAVRHALWLLVLIKLITPPIIPLSLPASWLDERSPPPEDAPEQPALAEVPAPLIPALSSEESPVALPVDAVPVEPLLPTLWAPAVMVLWMCGSFGWWMIAGMRLLRFHRLLRAAPPAPEAVQAQARRLAVLLGLRRSPPVLFVAVPLSPLLWALGFSPRLLVPADLWERLSSEQRDTLLAHELTHLRRGDHWVRRLEFIVLGLYWWHPVVWWARRRLQEAEEECCDAWVVAVLPDAAPAYASVLVETVAFLSQTRAAAPVGASGAGQVPLLKRRLTMILTANPACKPSRAVFWSVIGTGALLLPLTPGTAQTDKPKAAEESVASGAGQQPANGGPHPMRGEDPAHHPHFWLRNHDPFAAKVENCASCHDSKAVHARDLLEKPLTWREAHDAVVKLMDEMRRQQAQLREAENRPPVAAERDRAEQIERLQDEVELLKVQVQLKQAQLEAAKADAAAAETALRRMQNAGAAVPTKEVYKAEAEVVAQKAQIRIREAEMQEPLVRLKQAERRLARLHPPPPPPKKAPPPPPRKVGGGGSEPQERRLQELEQTIKRLNFEMEELRRELRRQKPADPNQNSARSADDLRWEKLGLRFRPVGADAIKGGHQFRGGLLVTEVRTDSPGERAGVRRGDILVGLDKFAMLGGEDVQSVLNGPAATGSETLKFYLLRGEQLQSGRFRLGQ